MFPELTFVLFLNSSDVFICWNILALSLWQMQGLSVDVWHFKISIAQDNLSLSWLAASRLWFDDMSQTSWQSVLVVVPVHSNCLLQLTVTKRRSAPLTVLDYESLFYCLPSGLSFALQCKDELSLCESRVLWCAKWQYRTVMKTKNIEPNAVTSFKILMWLLHRPRKNKNPVRVKIQITCEYHSTSFLIFLNTRNSYIIFLPIHFVERNKLGWDTYKYEQKCRNLKVLVAKSRKT